MAKIVKQVIISSEAVTLGFKPIVTSNDDTKPMDEFQLNETNREELREQAFQEGFISGKKEGQLVVDQQIEQLKQQLENLLITIPQAINQNRLELKTEIADIVLLITQEYFIEQQRNPEALQLQINQILNQLNSKQNIALYLHPNEIQSLQKANIKLEASHLTSFKIKADEHLALGGCVVKTEHGVFNASIETRIEKLKELLIQMKSRGPNAALD